MKDLILGFLTKTLNKTSDEVMELIFNPSDDDAEPTLKDGALEVLFDQDTKRVENLKKNVKPDKELLDQQYSRGLKEASTKLEKELKKQYNIESEKQGIELINEIVEANKEQAAKLSDEEVKKHPLYRNLEKDRVPKETHDKVLKEFDEYKQTQTRQQTFEKIKRDALKHLAPLNPVVSENPEVAKTREEDFLNKFTAYDYEIDENGNHFILKNGERLEDGHGNPVAFKDFVEQKAKSHFEFAKQNEKGSPENKNTKTKVTVPQSDDEYRKLVAEAKTPEERIALREAYEATQN